jgi:uncharacterized membrane protein
VNKEATLIMAIIIMAIIILALLLVLLRVIKAAERSARRMEGIDDYLFTKYLINEKDNEAGRTGESS